MVHQKHWCLQGAAVKAYIKQLTLSLSGCVRQRQPCKEHSWWDNWTLTAAHSWLCQTITVKSKMCTACRERAKVHVATCCLCLVSPEEHRCPQNLELKQPFALHSFYDRGSERNIITCDSVCMLSPRISHRDHTDMAHMQYCHTDKNKTDQFIWPFENLCFKMSDFWRLKLQSVKNTGLYRVSTLAQHTFLLL